MFIFENSCFKNTSQRIKFPHFHWRAFSSTPSMLSKNYDIQLIYFCLLKLTKLNFRKYIPTYCKINLIFINIYRSEIKGHCSTILSFFSATRNSIKVSTSAGKKEYLFQEHLLVAASSNRKLYKRALRVMLDVQNYSKNIIKLHIKEFSSRESHDSICL